MKQGGKMAKKAILALLALLLAVFAYAEKKNVKIEREDIMKSIHWLHHSSFRIETAGLVIYIDPFEIKPGKPADYIFITHNHYDHMSKEDIKKIAKKETLIICPEECAKELKDYSLHIVSPGDKFELGKLKCEAVAAYNTNKPYHPKKDRKVGYVIDIDKFRFYHAGDTDMIDEMKGLKDITMALVPIGGTFTMDPKEAAQAVNMIKPEIAVPMHYGFKVGKKEDSLEFKKMVSPDIKVYIMDPEG
jgi:L-ascorbate metabolism protein UlaG (beta-lactamase superfamily)